MIVPISQCCHTAVELSLGMERADSLIALCYMLMITFEFLLASPILFGSAMNQVI